MECEKLGRKNDLQNPNEKRRVAEIAKKAIQFMGENGIVFTPRNYDEWFFVVCKAMEEQHLLTKRNLQVLYEKYFRDIPKLEDLEEVKEVSCDLKEVAESSSVALDKFEKNIDQHERYIGESIHAIEMQDSKKMEDLRDKIATLEAENRKLKHFLEENRSRLEMIESKFQEKKKESEIDALTKLYNRRTFDKHCTMLEKSGMPYSIIFIDIDDFKKINDTYGHMVGDKILEEMGEILTQYVRKNTKSYRYGGEEFVILLPNTDTKGARIVANRLKDVIVNRAVKIDQKQFIHFTASFGVAQKEEKEEAKDVLKRADDALYKAKKEGKNRVITL